MGLEDFYQHLSRALVVECEEASGRSMGTDKEDSTAVSSAAGRRSKGARTAKNGKKNHGVDNELYPGLSTCSFVTKSSSPSTCVAQSRFRQYDIKRARVLHVALVRSKSSSILYYLILEITKRVCPECRHVQMSGWLKYLSRCPNKPN